MKLNQQPNSELLWINSYHDDHLIINQQRHNGNLVLTPQAVFAWVPGDFSQFDATAFDLLLEHEATIVLIGTGQRQIFPHPSLLRPLIEAQRGFEIMTTAAACRTFNILASEKRKVIAALVLPGASS